MTIYDKDLDLRGCTVRLRGPIERIDSGSLVVTIPEECERLRRPYHVAYVWWSQKGKRTVFQDVKSDALVAARDIVAVLIDEKTSTDNTIKGAPDAQPSRQRSDNMSTNECVPSPEYPATLDAQPSRQRSDNMSTKECPEPVKAYPDTLDGKIQQIRRESAELLLMMSGVIDRMDPFLRAGCIGSKDTVQDRDNTEDMTNGHSALYEESICALCTIRKAKEMVALVDNHLDLS